MIADGGPQLVSVILGGLLILAGVVFGLVEAGRVEEQNRLARSFDAWWRALVAVSWGNLPALSIGRLLDRLRNAVRADFVRADRGPAFGIVFLGMVFVLIPAAAVINLLTGGSPFLALYYLSNLIALAVLNFTGESRRLAPVNRTAAFYLGLSVFLIIPAYVLHSFTDRMLHSPITHAVLESLLVAPLLFIVAQSLMLGWESYVRAASQQLSRFVRTFLAALPVVYVLTFVAWQLGALAMGGDGPRGTWPLLLSSVLFGALAFSVTAATVDWAVERPGLVRLALGLAFAVAVTGGLVAVQIIGLNGLNSSVPDEPLRADLWVVYLPVLPLAYFGFGIVVDGTGKAFAGVFVRFLGDGASVTKPILAVGVLCVTIGIILWTAGRFIGIDGMDIPW